MWDDALRFLSLQDANVRFVVLGSMLLAGTTGVLGTFAFLQKRSLVGDAVAHATLPGVCIAFLLLGAKDPQILLLGAILSGWLSTICINAIRGLTPLKDDAAIAIVLTVFFGAGITLLTAIQSMGYASQAGLDKFLFGQAASLGSSDVILLVILSIFLCLATLLGFKEFKLICFDPEFARSLGYPVRLIEFVITTLVVIAVTIGIQMVGVALMSALLITPAAAARQWTNNLFRMIWISGGIGSFCGIAGAFASSLAPRMPTGPWMVVAVTAVFGLSALFAPERGVLSRAWLKYRIRSSISGENVLATLYRFAEQGGRFTRPMPLGDILRYRPMTLSRAKKILRQLKSRGLISEARDGWLLTDNGVAFARNLLRRHRLWELYLTQQLNLPPEIVHHQADEVEHWLTEAQEEELEKILEQPLVDPHDREIPQRETVIQA